VDPTTTHKLLYIADSGNSAVRVLDLTTNTLATVIGKPISTNLFPALFGATPGKLHTGDDTVDGSIYKPTGITLNKDGDIMLVVNDAVMQITGANGQ
jgi:DNA-binding beta-propeller fold protein YncE